jgi:hypothetical protein
MKVAEFLEKTTWNFIHIENFEEVTSLSLLFGGRYMGAFKLWCNLNIASWLESEGFNLMKVENNLHEVIFLTH